MKNKILISSALFLSALAYSQVGINNAEPKATIDIAAKSATGTIDTAEGMLIPRVDRERAQSMIGTEVSTLIYVNDISTGTQTGTAINIDKAGHYYFDGTAWKKLITKDDVQNIYNTDGMLTGHRKVSQLMYRLNFDTHMRNGFSVTGNLARNIFSVDGASRRVGIGTDNPWTTLDIVAEIPSGNSNTPEGVTMPRLSRERAQSMDAAAVQLSALIYVNDIVSGTQTGLARNIDSVGYYYYNGSFWVKLITKDDMQNIYNTNGTLTSDRTVAQDANKIAFTGSATNAFSIDGDTFSVDAANDRIGVGNIAPTAKLDVVGSATVPAIRARNLTVSNSTTIANKQKIALIGVDNNGVMVRQFSPVDGADSYSLDGGFALTAGGAAVPIFTGVDSGSIVTFKFLTNFAFGNSNTGIVYGQVSYSVHNGFQVASDWTHSGNSSSSDFILTGVGTATLTFSSSHGSLRFTYTGTTISAAKIGSTTTSLSIYEGKKMR